MFDKRFFCFALLLLSQPAWAETKVNGRLEWLERVELRAVETGVVEALRVSPAQRVSKGELLLRMDQRQSNARLLEVRARVAAAKLDTQSAERELTRAGELFDRGLIASEELKDAELGMAAATAAEQAAKAAETAAAVLHEYTELRAPFDGIVVARNTWQGEVIYNRLQAEPLLVVASNRHMLARVLVTADVLRRYRPGQRVQVDVGGKRRPATIYSLGVEAVRVEHSGAVYELDAVFEVRDGEVLRPSESVQLILP